MPPVASVPVTATATSALAPLRVYKTAAELDLAYNVAARGYLAAVPTLSPAQRAAIKAALAEAYRLVLLADRAVDAASFPETASVAGDALAHATSLLPHKNLRPPK